MAVVDEYALPASLLRHFDLTSTPPVSRRKEYPAGLLFIDRLLSLADIDGPFLYPPTSPVGYRRLLHAIHTSPLDRLKKDCFYYYLLKQPQNNEGGSPSSQVMEDGERSRVFAEARCLSKTWRVFMDGYWNLDHGLWEEATTNLTNPQITSINFPSEIISTLSTLAPAHIALTLIHRFLLTRLPDSATSESDLNLYTLSLAASQSVGSAFSFVRTLSLEKQSGLRNGIWSWAFGAPKSPVGLPAGHGNGYAVDQRAIKEILHLPLQPEEDEQLLQFLLSPPRTISPDSLSLLHDLVTLRLIHQGKYAESLQLDKELAGSGGSEESRQKRREMVREFIAILPEAQRRALAVDGEFVSSRKERNENGYMEIDSTVKGTLPVSRKAPTQTELPTPIKQTIPAFPLDTNQTPNVPVPIDSPAPQSRVVSINSPFSGPPRFAPSSSTNPATNSPQIARVLSGSPFTLPMSKGANAVRSASSSGMRTPTMGSKGLPIPRPKVRPVLDEEDVGREQRKTRKRARDSDVDMDQEAEQEHRQGMEEPADSTMQSLNNGNGDGAADVEDTEMETAKADADPVQKEKDPQEEVVAEKEQSPAPAAPTPRTRRAKPPPPPPPAPTSATPKRSTRKSTLPPPSPLHARIPGSFDLSIPQSVPEDKALQTKTRTPQARKTKTTTKPKPKEVEPPRSRMTRSVSRAMSLDPDASSPPAPVAAKRARSRRGSTATVASVAEDGGRGSPTPSTRSRVGSQTPRKSTRTRK